MRPIGSFVRRYEFSSGFGWKCAVYGHFGLDFGLFASYVTYEGQRAKSEVLGQKFDLKVDKYEFGHEILGKGHSAGFSTLCGRFLPQNRLY
jgi:hypothetical protein